VSSDFLFIPLVPADLVILAKYTLQVASGKENVADPFLAADGRFLTTMDTDRGNMVSCIAPAISQFASQPVHSAFARTQGTMFEIMHHGAKIKVSHGKY
jgi:hypothetical protein